ncbi:MAG: flavodoxin family protein [Armatimonadetes bacterium]|nr:flavodoxin family protein [Armatimonadota bacterium]
MNILGVSGSPRGQRSDSRRLVERVLEGAEAAGARVELVDLGDLHIEYCLACDSCHARGTCSRTDDVVPLKEKMLAADGLVLGSPLYFNSVTAQLKTVIDRMADVIHCQRFLGKYGCSVCVSGGPEHEIGTSYMNSVLVRLGCWIVGAVGATRSVPGSFEEAQHDATVLGHDLVQAIQEKRKYPEQEIIHAEMRERFRQLIILNKDRWPHEYEYWRDMKWLG